MPFSDPSSKLTREVGMERAFSSRRLRLSTLTRLRWLAIAGQTAAVVLIGFGLGFPVPFGACFALIALSAWVNIGLRLTFPATRRLHPNWATVLLTYDIVQLAGLLYLTGGMENPFAFLIIFPALVSATTMPPDKTLFLGGLAFISATYLVFFHEPLPWSGPRLDLPLLYVVGMWAAVVCSLVFMGFFAFRVAEEARQLADALAATELVMQREQHLSALDGLAAAAAHELGTPLGTITLVVKEMLSEVDAEDPSSEDLKLLATQTARCREILSKLTSLSSEPEEHLGRLALPRLLEEATAPHRDFGIKLTVDSDGKGPEPIFHRNPGILYGLGNILENALDFAKSEVRVSASWDERFVLIAISDDGPGFAPEMIERLGEPYVSTRFKTSPTERDNSGGGLGLGFFIAKTLLERSGARLSLKNRPAPETGAIVTIGWRRQSPALASDDGSDLHYEV